MLLGYVSLVNFEYLTITESEMLPVVNVLIRDKLSHHWDMFLLPILIVLRFLNWSCY